MSLHPITLQHFIVLSTVLFCIGMFGALSRRNAIGVLLSIELMFNAVNVLLVAFNKYIGTGQSGAFDLTGQLFAVFIVTVAAAEAAVGLAIVIAVYRLRRSVAVDQLNLMKG